MFFYDPVDEFLESLSLAKGLMDLLENFSEFLDTNLELLSLDLLDLLDVLIP